MNIKHMRLVLPARMTTSAQVNARMIAEAAARALNDSTQSRHPIRVQVQGQGRPAMFVAQSVFHETRRQVQTRKREG